VQASRRVVRRRFFRALKVCDTPNGFPVAYVYFADFVQQRAGTDRMSRIEARRMAVRIAALPELRQALREQRG
jgi:hypothetical protein